MECAAPTHVQPGSPLPPEGWEQGYYTFSEPNRIRFGITAISAYETNANAHLALKVEYTCPAAVRG